MTIYDQIFLGFVLIWFAKPLSRVLVWVVTDPRGFGRAVLDLPTTIEAYLHKLAERLKDKAP